jgi:IS5 family transposase
LPEDRKRGKSLFASQLEQFNFEKIGLLYRRELKKVLRVIRFSKSQKSRKKETVAIRRVKTMANALLRDIMRKLPASRQTARRQELDRYQRAVNQERQDKNKIYSLHEPGVCCIAKGKEHKKYEFGAKAAITMTKSRCSIVGVKNFARNEYDGDTLKTVLPQVEELRGTAPERALCDRGFRGRKRVGATDIVLPKSPSPKASEYAKRKARNDFCRRSAIEPVISLLKHDFRLAPASKSRLALRRARALWQRPGQPVLTAFSGYKNQRYICSFSGPTISSGLKNYKRIFAPGGGLWTG